MTCNIFVRTGTPIVLTSTTKSLQMNQKNEQRMKEKMHEP